MAEVHFGDTSRRRRSVEACGMAVPTGATLTPGAPS